MIPAVTPRSLHGGLQVALIEIRNSQFRNSHTYHATSSSGYNIDSRQLTIAFKSTMAHPPQADAFDALASGKSGTVGNAFPCAGGVAAWLHVVRLDHCVARLSLVVAAHVMFAAASMAYGVLFAHASSVTLAAHTVFECGVLALCTATMVHTYSTIAQSASAPDAAPGGAAASSSVSHAGPHRAEVLAAFSTAVVNLFFAFFFGGEALVHWATSTAKISLPASHDTASVTGGDDSHAALSAHHDHEHVHASGAQLVRFVLSVCSMFVIMRAALSRSSTAAAATAAPTMSATPTSQSWSASLTLLGARELNLRAAFLHLVAAVLRHAASPIASWCGDASWTNAELCVNMFIGAVCVALHMRVCRAAALVLMQVCIATLFLVCLLLPFCCNGMW